MSIFAFGKISRRPFAMFSATSRALSEPLNLSGAIKIRIAFDLITNPNLSFRAKRSGLEESLAQSEMN
jgi:hypothetical protein